MSRAALYIRTDPAGTPPSREEQEAACEAFASQNGHDFVARYEDLDAPGTLLYHKPGLKEAINNIKEEEDWVVLLVALPRCVSDTPSALHELVHKLSLYGNRLESPERAEGWGHVVRGMGPLGPDDANGLVVGEAPGGEAVAEIETAGGESVSVRSREAGPMARSRAMWALQARYPEETAVRRVEPDGAVRLLGGEALIRYRSFAPEELVEIVGSGAVLPAGVTRFRVRERVLGVRYPLGRMMDGEPRARNVELRRFVSERWAENRVRYYREPVVLFE